MHSQTTGKREFSSVGSEHLPYKQRVGGSNPSTPTVTETLIALRCECFFLFWEIITYLVKVENPLFKDIRKICNTEVKCIDITGIINLTFDIFLSSCLRNYLLLNTNGKIYQTNNVVMDETFNWCGSNGCSAQYN